MIGPVRGFENEFEFGVEAVLPDSVFDHLTDQILDEIGLRFEVSGLFGGFYGRNDFIFVSNNFSIIYRMDGDFRKIGVFAGYRGECFV